MWVIAGFDNNMKNDVWYSTDGVTWIQATANAGFSPRLMHSSLVFDNKMWVISGREWSGMAKDDAWYSTDGITWILADPHLSFSPKWGNSSLVFDNKMWIIAGQSNVLASDVWYSNFSGK
jgi:hypothetical protein